jgi:hypothetical protein
VHKVPLSQRTPLALDDEQRLAGEHEEVVLIGLPVIHRHRLAWREDVEADPELREVGSPSNLQIAGRPWPWAQRARAR